MSAQHARPPGLSQAVPEVPGQPAARPLAGSPRWPGIRAPVGKAQVSVAPTPHLQHGGHMRRDKRTLHLAQADNRGDGQRRQQGTQLPLLPRQVGADAPRSRGAPLAASQQRGWATITRRPEHSDPQAHGEGRRLAWCAAVHSTEASLSGPTDCWAATGTLGDHRTETTPWEAEARGPQGHRDHSPRRGRPGRPSPRPRKGAHPTCTMNVASSFRLRFQQMMTRIQLQFWVHF